MAIEAELCVVAHKEVSSRRRMTRMAGGAFSLLRGLMRAARLPEVIDIGMAPEAQIGFFAPQISGDITAVGLMTRAAALLGKGLVFVRFCAWTLFSVAAVAHLTFGLIEEERMLTGVGLMAVAAAPFFKRNVSETGLVLGGAVFVALETALGF